MKKVLKTILIVIYSIVAITTTILLLSFNEFRCSEIGGYTIYIVNDDTLEPEYVKGDLLIIEEASKKSIEVGDEVFMYKTISSKEFEVVCDKVNRIIYQGDRTLIELQSNGLIDFQFMMGEKEDVQTYHNWGTILGILESKWGYLFLIVIVSLFLFLQEAFELYMELRYGNEDSKEESKEVKKGKK